MTEPKYTVKDGIAFYGTPYKIDFIEFGYNHLDCDSIITEESIDSDEVEVVAYATEGKYNAELYDVYDKQYKNNGYRVMGQISSVEASSID